MLALLVGCGGAPETAEPTDPCAGLTTLVLPTVTAACFETDEAPQSLDETGCVLDDGSPAPGLIPFDVAAPLFSDGADKGRFLALPPGAAAGVDADGRLVFPEGAVLVKSFGLDQPIETRIMRLRGGAWEFHTYVWEAQGARLVTEEHLTVPVTDGDDAFEWIVPGEAECRMCHGDDLPVLGPAVAQLSAPVCLDGEATTQIEAWAARGWLTGEVPPGARLVDPRDESQDVDQRARSLLHANCAHCHRPGGWGPPEMTLDLRFSTGFQDTATCGVDAQYPVALDETVRIVPGSAEESVLWQRMDGAGITAMPLGAVRLDGQAIALVAEWIDGMEACPGG